MTNRTVSDKETCELGRKIAAGLKSAEVVCLYGDLGAGKTTLVKGIAEGLGIKEEITSPTFTLMNVYEVKSPRSKVKSLVHIDTYRLKDEQELLDIGAEDYVGQPVTVTIIEWPEKIKRLIRNKKVVNIFFDHGATLNERVIRVTD